MSAVRENLMTREGYSPYCGNNKCSDMPRTSFNGEQFVCSCCRWKSEFDKEFIDSYKLKWGIR